MRLHPSRQPTGRRRHKHPRTLPSLLLPFTHNPHPLRLILPPVAKLRFRNRPTTVPHPPHALPHALPHNRHGLGPIPRDLHLQPRHPCIHLPFTQLAPVLRRPLHDVRQTQPVQPRHVAVFLRAAPPRRAARAVQQFPEQVRRVRVGVARGGGAETRVQAYEHADQVRAQGVDEVVFQVRVFARGSIAAGGGGGGGALGAFLPGRGLAGFFLDRGAV